MVTFDVKKTHRRAAGSSRGVAPRGNGDAARAGRVEVGRALQSPAVQPKLTVGPPDDEFEREADRVAEQVMRMPDPVAAAADAAPPRIQQMCAECERERGGSIQREAGSDRTAGVPAGFERQLAAARSTERPLPASERAFFESRFGRDFGSVRLHSGPAASRLARSVHARAFTLGDTIVMGAGQYAPGTVAGRRLLAHELTHVVQQGVPSPSPEAPLQRSPTAAPVGGAPAHLLTATVVEPRPVVRRQSCPDPLTVEPEHPGGCPGVAREPGELGRFGSAPELEVLVPGECYLLWHFGSDRSEVDGSSGWEDLADLLLVDPGITLHVTGFTDCVGPAGRNEDLRMRRAWSVEAYLMDILGVGGDRIIVDPVSSSEYVETNATAEGRARNRSVAIRLDHTGSVAALPPAMMPVLLVAKSYIAPIGSAVGTAPCSIVSPPIPIPIPGLPPISVPPTTPAMRLRALAAATDAMMSENPLSDAKDKGYRLYSAQVMNVSCVGDRIVRVAPAPLDTDSGKEGPLQAPPLTIIGVTHTPGGAAGFDFSWHVKGRPHPLAETPFQAVCPRTSVYIWHVVTGRLECRRGAIAVTASITGSQFPSHRLFVGGTIRPPTVPQGPFSNLWVADPADPTLVQ